MSENQKYNVIICCVFVVCLCGTISIVILSDAGYTVRFEMDDNTLNYLLEHDYCIVHDIDSDFIFMGDCEYSVSFINEINNVTNINLSDELLASQKYGPKLEDVQWDYEKFPKDTRVVKREGVWVE